MPAMHPLLSPVENVRHFAERDLDKMTRIGTNRHLGFIPP
jgi:hypothetical protein